MGARKKSLLAVGAYLIRSKSDIYLFCFKMTKCTFQDILIWELMIKVQEKLMNLAITSWAQRQFK